MSKYIHEYILAHIEILIYKKEREKKITESSRAVLNPCKTFS